MASPSSFALSIYSLQQRSHPFSRKVIWIKSSLMPKWVPAPPSPPPCKVVNEVVPFCRRTMPMESLLLPLWLSSFSFYSPSYFAPFSPQSPPPPPYQFVNEVMPFCNGVFTNASMVFLLPLFLLFPFHLLLPLHIKLSTKKRSLLQKG